MFNYEQIRQINIENLKRQDLAMQLRFDQVNDSIKFLISTFLAFENKDINELSQNTKTFLANLYSSLKQKIDEISSFQHSPEESLNLAEERKNKIINELQQLEIQINSELLPIQNNISISDKNIEQKINDLKKKSEEIDNLQKNNNERMQQGVQKLDQLFQEKQNLFENQEQKIERIKKEAVEKTNELERKAQAYVANKTAKEYADIFSKQAKKNRNIALISLGGFIISTTALIILAVIFFKPLLEILLIPENNIKIEYLITNIVFRLTILSVAFIFIKESLKNYNVNMHLWNLNNQRKNALESFDSFIATVDEKTQNYLIEEIARTIYSVNKIGYLSEDYRAPSTNQVIELLKTFKS